MACGAPELQAPKLMSHDEKGHCFFARQPSTAQETDAAIRGTWASCCGAIRYSGRHRETLLRLAEMGLAEQCDSRLEDEPKPVMRNHVSFEFTETDTVSSTTDKSRAITGYLTGWLAKPGRGAVQKLRLSGVQSSFRYQWGDNTRSEQYCVAFALEPHRELCWLLRLLREDGLSSVAFAISIHEALEHDERFRQIQWFSDEEWQRDSENGRSRPY